MNQEQMIAAITQSIQTQSNLVLLLTTQITASLTSMPTEQLQGICSTLGIDYTQDSS